MASDYTSHYNLDKYVGTDKPNLRDQYNAAMDKIDTELWSQHSDVADAKASALSAASGVTEINGKLGDGFSSSSTVTQQMASKTDSSDVANAISTAIAGLASETYVDTAVDNAKKNLIVAIGDSWTQNGSFWRDYYASIYNDTIRSYAQGGVGFIGTTQDNPNKFPVQLNTAINDATLDKSKVTHVLVMGGVNDYTYNYRDAGQFVTVIADMNASIKQNFPNATPIFVVGNMNYRDYNSGSINAWTTDATNMNQLYVWNCVRKRCSDVGIPVATMYGWINRDEYRADAIHPTENGSGGRRIAANVHALIHGLPLQYANFVQTRQSSTVACKVSLTVKSDSIEGFIWVNLLEDAGVQYITTVSQGTADSIPFALIDNDNLGMPIPFFARIPQAGPCSIGIQSNRYAFYPNEPGGTVPASQVGLQTAGFNVPIRCD